MAVSDLQLLCKVVDIHLFNELYKRRVIKSKSFNFSNGLDDIRSKIMFTMKSLAVNTVKENELETVFHRVSFERDKLSLDYSFNRQSLQGKIGYSYIKNYIENVDCSFATIGYYKLEFRMSDIYNIFDTYRGFINCKETINGIINDILFVRSAVSDIGTFIKDVRSNTDEELCKLKYCQFMVNEMMSRVRHDLNDKLNTLKALDNKDEIFETVVAFDLTAPNTWNTTLETTIRELYTKYVSAEEDPATGVRIQATTTEDGQRAIVVNGAVITLNG